MRRGLRGGSEGFFVWVGGFLLSFFFGGVSFVELVWLGRVGGEMDV